MAGESQRGSQHGSQRESSGESQSRGSRSSHSRPPQKAPDNRTAAGSRRARILSEAGMLFAPLSEQQAFWTRHNKVDRRPWARNLADVASAWIDEGLKEAPRNHRRILLVCEEHLPMTIVSQIAAINIRSGQLTLGLTSSAAQFEVEKRHRHTLLTALQSALPDLRIHRLRATLTD